MHCMHMQGHHCAVLSGSRLSFGGCAQPSGYLVRWTRLYMHLVHHPLFGDAVFGAARQRVRIKAQRLGVAYGCGCEALSQY